MPSGCLTIRAQLPQGCLRLPRDQARPNVRSSADRAGWGGLSCLAAIYIGVRVIGAILGVWAAHLMFELLLWQLSVTARTGSGQWFAEAIATFGLLLTILGCSARIRSAVPYAVGLYITSAYWFTASTSFANPAVTIARSLCDTFAGIAPAGVVAFIVAQLVGMLGGICFMSASCRLYPRNRTFVTATSMSALCQKRT